MKWISAALLIVVVAGDEAADFSGLTWVDKAPDLKGKVVLVRWWTNGCSLCSGSTSALTELGKKATVVAVYHPKPPRDVSADDVRAFAKEIGMPGVLAIDRDWKVLDRWMPPKKRAFTSLTFVLDRKGKVRRIHPGGTIEPKDADELAQQIDALLAEKE
jgi:peroxiredoxin